MPSHRRQRHLTANSSLPKSGTSSGTSSSETGAGQLHQSASSSSLASAQPSKQSTARGERRPTELLVETFRYPLPPDDQFLRAASAEPGDSSDTDFVGAKSLPFHSGNPFVEKTTGIVHLYKENTRTLLGNRGGEKKSQEQQSEGVADADEEASSHRSTMLCLLAVPAKITCRELLQFLSPVSESIRVMRIIRDATPNQYMVLIRFKQQADADLFYRCFNGSQYNAIEPDLCHVAYVSKLETSREFDGASLAVDGHTELPTCPVCLERMDEAVDGVLTILCNHSFHGSCLSQWGDTSHTQPYQFAAIQERVQHYSCPVCRYCQTPELIPEKHKCMECGKTTDLWICLICGNIGCGRYEDAHAFQHFRDTSHTFSLQVGTQRVWDYAGDNYVHRLIQSKGDGKVVEYEPANRQPEEEEKIEAITLEYTYLLTNQLESQRMYFEEKLAACEQTCRSKVEDIEKRVDNMQTEIEQRNSQLKAATTAKEQLQRKLDAAQNKLQKVQQELKDEQEINKCLRKEQSSWAEKVQELEKKLQRCGTDSEKKIADLEEQLRDLMFHFEASAKLTDATTQQQGNQLQKTTENTGDTQQAIATADEIRDSKIEIGAGPQLPRTPNKRKQKKK